MDGATLTVCDDERPLVWSSDLTERELAVVDAVARGASNAVIAAELFVSCKTVEAHLTRVYRKLGVATRTQLMACMMRAMS